MRRKVSNSESGLSDYHEAGLRNIVRKEKIVYASKVTLCYYKEAEQTRRAKMAKSSNLHNTWNCTMSSPEAGIIPRNDLLGGHGDGP